MHCAFFHLCKSITNQSLTKAAVVLPKRLIHLSSLIDLPSIFSTVIMHDSTQPLRPLPHPIPITLLQHLIVAIHPPLLCAPIQFSIDLVSTSSTAIMHDSMYATHTFTASNTKYANTNYTNTIAATSLPTLVSVYVATHPPLLCSPFRHSPAALSRGCQRTA